MSAQLLLIGPDAWPFDDDRQAKLIAAIKGDLMYATGRFPDPLKYQVTDVRSSSGTSAPPGRKLLQARARPGAAADAVTCFGLHLFRLWRALRCCGAALLCPVISPL